MTKLLIVDDETGIVDEVKSFFEEEGFEVSTADTAKSGMNMVDEHKPDVLVLDIKLPDASGLEVLKHCKRTSPKTKIIVNTGYVDQNIIDEVEELGRDSFLQKPFNLEILSQEIDRVLNPSEN